MSSIHFSQANGSPMNVLQVISSSRTSGAEKHVVLLSEKLRALGHNVTAVCPPGGWLPDQLRSAGVPILELSMHGKGSASAILQLRKIIRQRRIDVVHTHLTRATYLGYFAGNISRVPVISSVHVLTTDFAYRWLPRTNHWFVAVSNFLRDNMINRGMPEDRVRTIYNGTDMQISAPGQSVSPNVLSVRAELGIPADALIVGQVGRVDSFKGAPLAVEAAGQVVKAFPSAYFVFVGHTDPEIQQGLWEMASQLGIGDRLRFTGVRNDIARLMSAMEVLITPSEAEACPMSVIEAMAMGKPVVASRVGGIPELIIDGETGLLIERRVDTFAEAIEKVLANQGLRDDMGAAAAERAEQMFTANVMAANMAGLYRQVIGAA
ncbi:MAG: glycosyltransferase family 4 protein [Chthonomonadales bacterium]